MNNTNSSGKKISIRRLIICIIIVMIVISVLLLAATFRVATEYSSLSSSMNNYTQWQRDANNLQVGSDYLTEQVRNFVVTGERQYHDNYFEEANVTRRRDKAVESVRELMGETQAYESLVAAMGESIDLMNREYYAMRLAVSGFGLDLQTFPKEIRDVELSAADLAATPEEQRETARMMVFDDIYHGKKEAITSNIQACLASMDEEMHNGQEAAQKSLSNTLMLQRVMIVISIIVILITLIMFLLLVVRPLVKAVAFVQNDQDIPVSGSKEFQFLAEEYNIIHQTNASQKQELAYEATHDNLTGVYNRNGYDALLQSVDWDTCALVLFDLDRFKSINDQYGHKVGDRVLARTARAIQNAFRAQDHVCRIGGDEFAVIMTQMTPDLGDPIREKVKRINSELKDTKDDVPGIQTSCGVAFGALIKNFDALFREADAALYRIKNGGGGDCEICR